jgi:predicted metalloprotease
MGRPANRRFRLIALIASAALGLSACAASTVDGHGGIGAVPNADLTVIDDSHSALDTEVKNALADVMEFWKDQYPKVANGKALPPIKGGLYSVDALKAIEQGRVPGQAASEGCVKQDPGFIIDNAAFCRLDDSIIWDRSDTHLIAQLQKHYGDLLIGLIFAHEFGHAVQDRLGIFDKDLPTVDTESQADCAAGAWAAAALANQAPHFRSMQGQLDKALEGFLDVRDSTPDEGQDISHGDGFDRIAAIEDGIQHGVTFCYAGNYFNRKFTERPYVTDTQNGVVDKAQNGNEPIDQILNPAPDNQGGGGLVPDLNRFWSSAAQLIHKNWQDVKIAEADHPKCGASAQSEFGYCPDDNTVYYSKKFAEQAYNSLPDVKIDDRTANVTLLFNQPADFTLGTLFVVAWGLAVRHQLFNRSTDDKAALLAASCYAGAYAEDINIKDDPSGKRQILLSPPDMDEATSAMLSVVGLPQAFGDRGTNGRDRIAYFVKGYNGTLSVC